MDILQLTCYYKFYSEDQGQKHTQNDKLIEAGDWMETKIFGEPKENPDPFSLKID
ncbi:hypothetical protein pb186bvf_014702 [Paramecium bursaria]